ncbi:MAG TPA: apolipoprotein N-acyltransferase [Blastocatellia bacterium]|nr:apolipoprotein N-acyltransferase [Blastocatellia bacterium]
MSLSHYISDLSVRAFLARWWQFAAAVASGLLMVLAFEPFNYTLLAWVALAPLLYALSGEIGWKRALVCGWLAGVTFFFFSTNWITHSMIQFGGMAKPLAYGASFLFSAVVAIFPGLFALVMARLVRASGYRALLLAPFVWVATEWLRGIITGATWNALGISQVDRISIALWAKVGGVWLVSGFVTLPGAILAAWKRRTDSVRKFIFQLLPVAVAALLLWWFFPPFLLVEDPIHVARQIRPDIDVAAVQPDIPLSIYESPGEASEYFERTLKLTRGTISQAGNQKTDLIVWAESPLTLNYEHDEAVRARLNDLVQQTGDNLIFSAIARDGDHYFNSAQTIAPPSGSQPVRQLRRYDKIRLVPFGEYVPFRFALGCFVPPMVGDFTPGREAAVNTLRLKTQHAILQNEETDWQPGLERTTNFARTGTFICYEAAYPNLVRQFVRNGATLLINISNDAWFGNTAGARQHLAHARMRAIENDRDLVRVTNSGISALITADGRVADELPTFTPAAKVWQAHLNSRETFYTRYGDWFPLVCTLISLIAPALSLVRPRSSPVRGNS